MSTRARKDRKARGEKIVREPKVGTPLFKRRSFLNATPRVQARMAETYGKKVPVRNTFRVKSGAAA